MNKNCYLFLILLIGSIVTKAQTISIEFPHFAGQTYEFKIFQGDKQITLKEGSIPKDGKVQLIIPQEYAGYKGIAQWYLTNSKTGGGLDLIINNQDFWVVCLDSIPTNKSIVYKGSNENVFSKANYLEQQKLFEQHDAMLAAVRAYSKDSKLYNIFEKEYINIINEYALFARKLAESPLYAAKFRQIVNMTMGIGTIITNDQNVKANNINDFIVNDLDFAALYTSNHWGGVINNWVQLQTVIIKDDTKLLENTKFILKRLPSDKIYTDFVTNLTRELSKVGKDNILAALISDIKNSNRLLNYTGVLSMYQKDMIGKAPDLVITEHIGKIEEHKHQTTIVKSSDFAEEAFDKTLLVFYKSGCGPCEETMQALQGNYMDLQKKGFKIISIAADTDEHVFKNTSSQFPWEAKYCDFEGTNGINFKNYAVIGTPTMYILDKQGTIIKKLATVQELLNQF